MHIPCRFPATAASVTELAPCGHGFWQRRWCIEQKITFTRSRPGSKNDGAHVEQKNWARVRELVGYYRYDTAAELARLNEIWDLDAVFASYFLPQQKLIFKQRIGAKVTKRHDTATTPHQRAVVHPQVRKRPMRCPELSGQSIH